MTVYFLHFMVFFNSIYNTPQVYRMDINIFDNQCGGKLSQLIKNRECKVRY